MAYQPTLRPPRFARCPRARPVMRPPQLTCPTWFEPDRMLQRSAAPAPRMRAALTSQKLTSFAALRLVSCWRDPIDRCGKRARQRGDIGLDSSATRYHPAAAEATGGGGRRERSAECGERRSEAGAERRQTFSCSFPVLVLVRRTRFLCSYSCSCSCSCSYSFSRARARTRARARFSCSCSCSCSYSLLVLGSRARSSFLVPRFPCVLEGIFALVGPADTITRFQFVPVERTVCGHRPFICRGEALCGVMARCCM